MVWAYFQPILCILILFQKRQVALCIKHQLNSSVIGVLLFNQVEAIIVERIEYRDFGQNVKSIVTAIFAEVSLEVF